MEKLWYLIAVLLAIVITLALGTWAFATADEVATAIGPVVTALGTIGAALLGVSVGREAGRSEGHEAGKEAGRKQTAAAVAAHLDTVVAGNRQLAGGGATGQADLLAPLRDQMRKILEGQA